MRRIVRLLLSGSFLWMVSPVFAQDVLFSSQIFQKFDIKLVNDVGLILPVIVAWFAIKVASLMRGGKLEHVWKLIAAGMSVLALVKVVDGLENLGILYVGGLRSVLEFVMILVFLSAFVLAYQSLEMAIRGPIPVENPKIELPSDKASEASGKKEKK